jgi:hypothetical protein
VRSATVAVSLRFPDQYIVDGIASSISYRRDIGAEHTIHLRL